MKLTPEQRAKMDEFESKHGSTGKNYKLGMPISLADYCERSEDEEYRRIGKWKGYLFVVSTVWLGLDHGLGTGKLQIFETMVFGKWTGSDRHCERYATLEEAKAGHERVVRAYKYRIDKWVWDFIRYKVRGW